MPRSKKWKAVGDDIDRSVHVVPIDDLKRHHISAKCWCKPVIEKHAKNRQMIVHNSMDGRELIEQHGVN